MTLEELALNHSYPSRCHDTHEFRASDNDWLGDAVAVVPGWYVCGYDGDGDTHLYVHESIGRTAAVPDAVLAVLAMEASLFQVQWVRDDHLARCGHAPLGASTGV